jgi:hypothetical protein
MSNMNNDSNSSIPEAPLNVPGPQGRRMPTQGLLLLLILSVSAASLYGMRRYGMKAGFSFETVAVDYKEQDSEKARTYERIMADLSRIQNPLDVTLTEFGKSPFMRDSGESRITPDSGPIQPGLTDIERRRAEAVDRLKRLKLRGIIGNIARIDEATIRVGDTVDTMFLVTAIDGRTVTFEAYGETFTLTLENTKPTQKKAATRMGPGSTMR